MDDHGWEIQARTRIEWLRSEVHEAARRRGGAIDSDDTAFVGAGAGVYEDAFADALARLHEAEAWLGRFATAGTWLRGTRVEGAWSCIHSAHARLIELAGNDQVWAMVPDVRSAVAAYLPDKDPWRKTTEAWISRAGAVKGTALPAITDYDRELLSNALRRAYDSNAERYTQLRRFRNILLGTAAVFALIASLLSVVGAAEPTAIPLCFPAAAADEAGEEEGEEQVCPSGDDDPSAADAALVALLGLAGGAIGGARSLTRSSRATVSAYTLRVARMALKVALGAATAVLGLLFLQAGFAPGFDGLDSQAEVLGYAVVFGATQQLLTRLADQQAETVLKGASSEDDSDSAAGE